MNEHLTYCTEVRKKKIIIIKLKKKKKKSINNADILWKKYDCTHNTSEVFPI